jgi:hypothetical protein
MSSSRWPVVAAVDVGDRCIEVRAKPIHRVIGAVQASKKVNEIITSYLRSVLVSYWPPPCVTKSDTINALSSARR